MAPTDCDHEGARRVSGTWLRFGYRSGHSSASTTVEPGAEALGCESATGSRRRAVPCLGLVLEKCRNVITGRLVPVTVVMLTYRRTGGCEAASMTHTFLNYLFHSATLKQIPVPVEETTRHFDLTLCGVSVTPILNIVGAVLIAVGMLCLVRNVLSQKADTWPTKRFLVSGAILLLPGAALWLVNTGVDPLAAIA